MADRQIPDVNNNFSLTAVSNDGLNQPVTLWADPITHLLQVSGSGGGGGGAVTIADGADVAEGATTDAAVAAGSTGSVSGKLRQISADISTSNTLMATAANQTTMNSNLTSIVTNTAAGATSANQTNGTQQAKLTDGTNVANVVAGDTGFNGVATTGAAKTIAFTTSTPGGQVFGPYNVEGYSLIEVQYTSVGSGFGVSGGQFSPTQTGTYTNSVDWSSISAGSVPTGLGATVNSVYVAPVRGNWFQIQVSALTSGTVTGTVTFRAITSAITRTVTAASQSGTWTVGSNSATGSATPANAFYIAIANSAGQLGGVASIKNAGDASAGDNSVSTGIELYNNSTFDRQRNNTSVVVVAAGQTSTTTQTLTTYNARSLVLAVNITAGVGTLTVAISGITISGYTYPILTSTALTGIADNTLRVFPGATPATNTVANDALPRTLSITYTVASSVTFGSDAVLSV